MSGHKTVSYVVAVSGGVDSVVLLDILAAQLAQNQAGQQLIIAHFDHGIRDDSAIDRQFVAGLAKKYGLPFAYDEGRLGAAASEATARDARYGFLRQVQRASGSQAIITAHHEDDLFETAILNLLRGTGRKGLSSLQDTPGIRRPLLATPKQHLKAYAATNNLAWREDPTNARDDYVRNYVRHHILPKFDEPARALLRRLIETSRQQNMHIDQLLADQLHLQPAFGLLDRQWFIMLPHAVAAEIMAAWLRGRGIRDFDRGLIERLVIAGKSFPAGKQIDVNRSFVVQVRAHDLSLEER